MKTILTTRGVNFSKITLETDGTICRVRVRIGNKIIADTTFDQEDAFDAALQEYCGFLRDHAYEFAIV